MKQGFPGYIRIAFLTIVGAFVLSGSMAQDIYIDTITYQGTLRFKKGDILYKRIKAVVGKLDSSFAVHDPEPYPADETLLLFDKPGNCVLNFKLNELLADHEDATIMTTDCVITDSALMLTRYGYWSGLCNGCKVSIEHFTYGFNNAGTFCLKDSSSAFTYDPKEKLKLSNKDKINFRRVLMQSLVLDETDRNKLYEYLE